jgi:retinol-binding protein 3
MKSERFCYNLNYNIMNIISSKGLYMTNNMNFSYQNKSYDVSLKPIVESSDKTITVDGRAYQILGSEEAIVFFKSQVEKIGTTDFENFDSLEISLKQIDKQEGSKQEKIDSVFQKTIDISTEKTNSIIDKNIGSIDIPDTIKEIGKKLEQYYIFPAVAKKCSEYLQLQLKSGAYEKFSDLKSFADAVTNDLREISKDEHMTFDLLEELSVKQIETEKVISYSTPDLVESYEYKSDHFKEFPYELKSGRLKDDRTIGYLDLRTMGICKTGDDDSNEVKKDGAERRTAFIKAVNKLKGTKSIIIDLRNNGGGKPNAVQLLCSLFMEEGSHLDGIERRKGDSYVVETWDTLPYEDLPKEARLLEQKVVILISPNTFSAAESCANSMRASKGATIVGERSKGGANPGGYEPIGKYFDIRIPSGRAINPLQEGNWEGVGIIPDHEVSAKDALNMAISL